MVRKIRTAVVAGAAGVVAVYAIAALVLPGVRSPIVSARLGTAPVAIAIHLLGGAVALGVGPLQLSEQVRRRRLRLHRWCGRAYVLSVVVGGVAALALAPVSEGGLPAHVGFGLLASAWLIATLLGYRAIRRKRQAEHRVWMLRSYGLTFAAVTLRVYLPISHLVGLPYESSYQAISWLCWVPNLLVVEWLILSREQPVQRASEAA
jgi:uncharacterized membrane protein